MEYSEVLQKSITAVSVLWMKTKYIVQCTCMYVYLDSKGSVRHSQLTKKVTERIIMKRW